MLLQELPKELLRIILDNLYSNRHKNSFILSCRRVYSALNIFLYRDALKHGPERVCNWSAMHGREDTMDKLIHAGLDISEYKFSSILLAEAARHGQADFIRCLLRQGLKHLNVLYVDATPLVYAAAGGHADTVRLLLDHGARIDVKSLHGQSPLMAATAHGHESLVSLLLDRSANPSALNDPKQSALWLAVNGGHVEVMKLLLDRTSQDCINVRDRAITLWRAIELKSEEAVRLFLRHGAQINGPHRELLTPSMSTAMPSDPVSVAQQQMLRQLRERANRFSHSALELAIRHELTDMVRLMLDEGAVAEEVGNAALRYAKDRRTEDIAEFLTQRGFRSKPPEASDGAG
ncbi:ankyrin repeat domain-containing protein [Aspergillus stella-maris]|uniref:ankyrin repeat domain-containing protein n=1 Tax=Aspergillus stella-maris TaxID=1810926 RepID=UPI003CCD60BF